MSALVLVMGALILVFGGYEMIAGSGDILSERGWSAYIAGAVLLAGGVVTVALGLVLRAIETMQGVVPAKLALPSKFKLPMRAPRARTEPLAQPVNAAERATDETTPVLAMEPVAAAPEPSSYEPAAADEPPPPTAEPEGRFEPFHVASAEPVVEEPPAAHEPIAREPTVHEPPVDTAPAQQSPAADTSKHDEWLDFDLAALEREMGLLAHPEPARSPRSIGPATSRYQQHLSSGSTFASHSVSPDSVAAPDHENSVEPDLADREAPPTAPEVHPEPTPDTFHSAEPIAAASTREAAATATETPATPPPAVIGRYDSDGTSYVMYADGSIDAQSEAGVYRFASMAELKAFIES